MGNEPKEPQSVSDLRWFGRNRRQGLLLIAVFVAGLLANKFVDRAFDTIFPGDTPPKTEVVVPSSAITNINENRIVQAAATQFKAPDALPLGNVGNRLDEFRARYPSVFVRVEAENGSSERDRVAQVLGGLLKEHQVGVYQGGIKIGIAPTLTLFHPPNGQQMASDFEVAISDFLRGKIQLVTNERLAESELRFYLYGTPTFAPDGVVTFE